MKFGSLFAGIGGFDLGFERAGMECAWQVEIDDYCQRVLTKHWPHVPKYGDIRNVGKQNLEAVELICGGFPCQPYSTAGKQRGEEDDRHLWPEMLRVVSELKPAWVVGENVPGIIPIFIDQVLSDLEAEGYTCETFIIPACAFDAPHIRERVFIIAFKDANRIRCNGSERQEKSRIGGQRQPSTGDIQWVHRQEALADAKRERRCCGVPKRKDAKNVRQPSPNKKFRFWTTEPDVGRVAHGVPHRVDRLRTLGNAVVPQVAQFIGEIIMQVEAGTS